MMNIYRKYKYFALFDPAATLLETHITKLALPTQPDALYQ